MKYLATALLSVGVTVGGIVGFLYGQGNINVQKQEQTHNKQVIIDGVITEDSTWIELNGYEVSIDLKDGVYFGK